MEQKKIILPDGWEIDKVEGNEIILKESKKELPKSWEECYKQLAKGEYISSKSGIVNDLLLLNPTPENYNMLPEGLGKPMIAFCQLLVCRDVYRQGWKPDWKNDKDSIKYCICYVGNSINIINNFVSSRPLSFQSREIAGEFLRNFSSLIEEARELI